MVEVESRKPRNGGEAETLKGHLAVKRVIACDERGKARASRAFAGEVATLRTGAFPGCCPGGGADALSGACAARRAFALGQTFDLLPGFVGGSRAALGGTVPDAGNSLAGGLFAAVGPHGGCRRI